MQLCISSQATEHTYHHCMPFIKTLSYGRLLGEVAMAQERLHSNQPGYSSRVYHCHFASVLTECLVCRQKAQDKESKPSWCRDPHAGVLMPTLYVLPDLASKVSTDSLAAWCNAAP